MSPNLFRARRDRLAAEIAERKLDAIVIGNGPNLRYLTGFAGSNGLLLLARGEAMFFTDPRYTIQAGREVDCRAVTAKGPLIDAMAKAAARRRIRRIGFESGRMTVDAFEALRKQLPAGRFAGLSGLVERHRMIKSDEEIEAIRRSVRTNSQAFDDAVRRARPGMSESDLAAELEYRMRRRGAEKPSFETIVAAGERSALPHAQPGAARIAAGDLVLVDMGSMQDGYASDMTRMLFFGRPPAKVRTLYRAVLDAQLAALAAVRPGVTTAHVDRAARNVLKQNGLDKLFVHSTGHGLGLEIHEPPRIGRKDKTRLEAGMAITIEPGVYVEGYGGIRIEDTAIVTRTGCDVLTPTPKELLML